MSKRDLIHDTLQQLIAAIPTEEPACKACNHVLSKLPYTAPELMDRLWAELYDGLTREQAVPCAADIWNAANERYNALAA